MGTVMDAAEGVLWNDDKQVVSGFVTKHVQQLEGLPEFLQQHNESAPFVVITVEAFEQQTGFEAERPTKKKRATRRK
jgi:hypothetical protein